LSGRPINGDPGGSAGAAAVEVAGCCAAAVKVNAPTRTPASNKRVDEMIM
jgi:hypothetical protein